MTRLHDSYLAERRNPFHPALPMFSRLRAPWWRRFAMWCVRRWACNSKTNF